VRYWKGKGYPGKRNHRLGIHKDSSYSKDPLARIYLFHFPRFLSRLEDANYLRERRNEI
jgi:hypothetical protein